MARAVAVLGELAQPQGHCRAPQRATDLPGGCIPGRWVRAPQGCGQILYKMFLAGNDSTVFRQVFSRRLVLESHAGLNKNP